jgi:hypothetical protein
MKKIANMGKLCLIQGAQSNSNENLQISFLEISVSQIFIFLFSYQTNTYMYESLGLLAKLNVVCCAWLS